MTREEKSKWLEVIEVMRELYPYDDLLIINPKTYRGYNPATGKEIRVEQVETNYADKDIYPLTIINDRYGGCYSGGEYTAWNLEFDEIPEEINWDDVSCNNFWIDNEIPVGKGATPMDALNNLQEILNKKEKGE